MARIPPFVKTSSVKMSYPCNECNFEAQSARQLSRHKAVTHVENALKCVLCPFVTAYQTNLLRHRREVHGICGSKGNKSCKFCGFLSEDNETLIRHQLEVHRDILKSAQVKFAKELVSAGGEDSSLTGNQYPNTSDYIENQTQNRFEDESNVNQTQEEEEEDDDKNFWKEAYEDNGPNFFMNLASYQNQSRTDQTPEPNASWYESSGQPSPPSHENSISEFVSSRASTPKNTNKKMAIPAAASNDDLPATRIRRQYTCNDCGFRTINPREFLYHRRDAHGQRLKIVECPYCVYACQYVQKLQRHLLLVHKLETSMTPPPEVAQTATKSNKPKVIPKMPTIIQNESPELSDESAGTSQQNVVPKIRVKLPTLTSPAMVTTNQVSGPLPPPPKAKLVVNQKSVSDQKRKMALQRQISANQKRIGDKSIFAKKYHKCQTCGYMTNVQYLFKKHMKYHSAPKIKCEMCDFESPYSWNVDRHVRSHFSNGLFKCTKCSFACDKKQALTVHMTQHHRDKTGDQPQQPVADPIPTDEKPVEDEEEEAEIEMNQTEDNQEVDGQSLAHLFTQTLEEEEEQQQEGPSSVNRGPPTFVRQNDGKIVAKHGVKKCKYCNFQTDTFAKLQKHESSFHPEKRFQCPLCEIKFENLVWLQRHLTHMHQEDTQANNIVTILEQLNPKRKRTHPRVFPSTSTPNSQNIPEVVSPTLSAKQPNLPLKRKPQALDKSATQCQVCGYQTRWISELEKHMRVHTKERPFACPYCSFKSKWKGDLNRHIQKYHSRLPMPDLNLMEQQIQSQDVPQTANENSMEWIQQNIPQESTAEYENDASILSGEVEYEDFDDNIDDIKMDDKPLPDDYEERPLVFDDLSDDNEENEENTGIDMGDDDNENELHIDFDDKEGIASAEGGTSESPNELTKSGKVKMYRCSYCDFTCSTASRFHVHFVQHLNTKPFQCSVCGHRSNWEWDVTKHIKMKSQRDAKHSNAKAMLVHESGKRDYSKYNKYVVWVNQKEAIASNVSNPKIDFRAKRAKLEATDGTEYDDNDVNQSNEMEYEEENHSYNCDPESIVITPDICFEVQGEEESTEPGVQFNQGFNPSLQPNVAYNSNANTSTDDTKILQCSYCDFKHKESKVMVSHLSNHANMKPYRCRKCGFDSKWREVVVRHCVSRHQSNSDDVEQRFRCTVNKSFCKIVEDSVAPKIVNSASTSNAHLPSAVKAFQESHQSVRISGFKGSFVCDLCPFRAEKAFHMDFHVKRHQPSSGPFKCPHCPYWVNAKKSLVKHMLLHADHNPYNNDRSGQSENQMANEMEDDYNDESENELVINEDNEQHKYFNQSNLNLSAVRQSASVSKNRCDKCPFIAGTKTQLLYHKQFHRPNRSAQYSCTLCTYSVSYLHLLNQHMKVHYQSTGDQMPVNYYELPQEEESLLDESDDRDESDIPFTWVQIGNNKRKLFQCRFCSTTSKRRTYIYVHERLHTQNTGNETFKCTQQNCQFETRDSTLFLNHHNQHNSDEKTDPPKEETVKEDTMDTIPSQMSTPSVSVIDVNSFRHGNRRMFSYVCPDCPAAFKSPGDLKIHSAFHNTEYDHHCFYCSYKAKNKPQLCKHLYVHTAEYIAKRANSYPDGTKLLIGNAVEHMKRDMRSPLKEGPIDDKKENSSPQLFGATSLLKKSDKPGQSSPPWTGIAKELNGGTLPKRAAMIGRDGRSPREQMLLLELSESNAYLEKLRTGVKHRFIYRCSHCPAVFMKVNTLTFHISMHGNEEQNKCKLCSYSTNSANNLIIHQQLHDYSSFASVGHSVYNHRCTRCPAAFSKKSRLEKHLTLHGLDAKWKCDQCDYAVHYAATLVKHRACHQMNPNFKVLPLENRDNQLETKELKEISENENKNDIKTKEPEQKIEESESKPKDTASTTEQTNDAKDSEKEEKILYCCDRCPYVHNRKDAVQSHLKRHDQQIRNVRDGKQCPYCDYTCLQPSYLREHIQWHFDPQHDRKPSLFTYWNDLEVWKLETIDSQQNGHKSDDKSDNEDKQLLFKDNGKTIDIRQRFEPPEDDPEFFELYDSYVDIESEEENEPPIDELSDALLS